MSRLVYDLGALRTAMAVVVLALLAAAPFALQQTAVEGWALLWTVVAPALFVIFIFILPLDLVMTLVFMADKQGDERSRLRRVLITEGALTVLLAAAWTPFVLNLASTGS